MRGAALRRVSSTAMLILSMLGALAASAGIPPAQAADAILSYRAYADPLSITLCPGESREIKVYIRRSTFVNGQHYGQRVGGGRITGLVGNLDVAYFDPVSPSRPISGGPDYVATFQVVADSPGTTEITFAISSTGEEARLGAQWQKNSDTVTVEVTDCYEAYSSGLATIFTQKWMDKLRDPFVLAGYTPNVQGITTASQLMFFIPNPQNRLTGGYAFVDSGWATAEPRTKCTAYISGRYDVVFYPDAEHPVEGDLLMKGSGVAVCKSGVIPIDYRAFPGFQIAFKPAPPL